MDYSIHRLRFGDWQPSVIRAIAADPFSTNVAVGREDGDIEICDSSNKWYTQTVLPGSTDFKLQSLVWSSVFSERGRLFGVSLRGFIFELDLATLTMKSVRDSYGGAAWCIAATSRHPTLAVGCEDGAIRLFRYDGGVGTLEYVKSLPTTGARILCAAYHPVASKLFMGCEDGTIRCVDETSGRSLFRMTGDILRGVPTYIWSLAVLSDSTIVSGDSRGHVQVWDGETGVLMVTLHQHTADILALAVSPDESQIFASGVDCRVTCIRRVANAPGTSTSDVSKYGPSAEAGEKPPSSPADYHWVYSTSHRPHSHDVFALAVCCPQQVVASSSGAVLESVANSKKKFAGAVLLSGGLDTKLCVYSIDEFARHRPSWVLPVPASGLLSASSDGKLHAVRHRNKLDLWSVNIPKVVRKVEGEGEDEEEIVVPVTDTDDDSRCQLALRLELKGGDHIHCVAVSADASALACSSARAGTRVWALSPVGPKGDLSVQKLSVPVQAAGFCHSLAFSDDGRRLAAYSAKGLLLLMSIAEGTVEDEEEESDGEEDDDDDEEDAADTDDEERESGDDDSENDVEDDDDGDDDDEEEEDSEVDGSDENQDSDDDDVKSSKKRKRSKKSSKKASGSSKKNKKASNASSKSKLRAQLHHAFDHKSQVLSTSGATSSSTGLGCSISKMCFSPDGMYLAAADADKTVYVYDIDRLRLHWRLPRFSSPITAIRFHPLSPSTLVVVLADNTFSIFEVGDLSLSLWSQKNTERIPAALKEVPGPIQGVSFDIGSGDVDIEAAQDTMILYGQGFIVYVNLSDEIPVNPKVVPATAVAASDGTAPKKERRGATKRGRRRRGGSKESNFAIIQRYRSLIHVNCLPDSQMVLVENPWVRILEQLPDTLARKRYGT